MSKRHPSPPDLLVFHERRCCLIAATLIDMHEMQNVESFFSYCYNLLKSSLEVYFYRTLSKNNKGLGKLYFADLRSDALKLQAYMNGAWIVPADSLKCLQWLFKRRFGSFVLHSWLWIEFNLSVSRPRGHCRHVDGCFHTSRCHRSCGLAFNGPKTACAPK